ncbi:hypothetical protein F2Q69_00048428 [Brassica cretica]|uniref:Uncharacterized protein n=1 Tax=Brassica cretica TaxID=69181 RepID=A0A8S9PNF4_BRACR|nr:hypothetical protein F2Q69_00048428 [Brassica cretica]
MVRPQHRSTDIADSAQKNTDVSSCYPGPDVDREITMEDFLELEEFLELEDGEKLEELDSGGEVTMEDFLEPEIWIKIQRRSLMMISILREEIWKIQRLALIDTNLMRSIDIHPTSSINTHLIPSIDNQQIASIYTHTPSSIGTNPIASIDTHADSPIPTDKDEVDKGPAEAASIDTNQIPSNDTNKPSSIDITTSPSIDTGRVSRQKDFDVCGNLRDGGTTTRSDKFGGKKRRNWKKRKRIMGDPQVSLIPHSSDGVRKSRVCSRCFSMQLAKEVSIDAQAIASIDTRPKSISDS